MRFNPDETKASSNANDVGSSTVQPKTLPPNASGATSNPEFPSLRFFILSFLIVLISRRQPPHHRQARRQRIPPHAPDDRRRSLNLTTLNRMMRKLGITLSEVEQYRP